MGGGTQGGHPLPQCRSSKCMAPQAREISAGPLYRLRVGTEIHTNSFSWASSFRFWTSRVIQVLVSLDSGKALVQIPEWRVQASREARRPPVASL